MLSSDLPLCFQFLIHMQNSSLGNLTFLPLLFVSLSSLTLFLLGSFTPSRLAISSHPALKSLFQFQDALKPMPAQDPPPFPLQKLSSWTSYLFSSLFYISPHCVIHPPPLRHFSPHLALPISLHFFFYWMYCSCLKNWFLDRGEVNLLWPGIPSWASPLFTFFFFF